MKVINHPPTTSSQIETSQSLETGKSSKAKEIGKKGSEVSSSSQSRQASSVEISDKARLMQKAMEVAKGAPDVDREKVASLKKRILDGSYQVDSGAVAERLIEDHLQSHFGKNNL